MSWGSRSRTQDRVIYFLDRDLRAFIPALYVSSQKYNFCFRVSFDEFFREADGRDAGTVRHCLIISRVNWGPRLWGFRLESADSFGAIVDIVKWFVSMEGGLDNQAFPIRLALLLPVRRSRPLQGFARVKLVCLMKLRAGQGSDIPHTHRPGSGHCQYIKIHLFLGFSAIHETSCGSQLFKVAGRIMRGH